MATPDKPSSPSSPMDSPTEDETTVFLDPTGKDHLTVMNHDDYDAATMSRVTIKADAIKADAHDTYSNKTDEFIDSPTLGSAGKAKSIFINLSNSDSDVGLGLRVIKGTQGALVREGHPATHDDSIAGLKDYSVLLRDVNDKSGKQELTSRVGDLQRLNNSTDSYNVFVPNDTITNERSLTSNIGNRIIPTMLGVHNKIESYASNHSQENRILADDMLNIGAQIPMQSSGENYIPKFGLNQTTGTRGSQILLAIAGAMTPNLTRTLGARQNVNDLSAKRVLNSVRRDDLQIHDSNAWPDPVQEEVMTNGSYYNWLIPFEGATSNLQIPTTIILVSTIAPAVLAMAETIDGMSNAGGTIVQQLIPGIPNKEENFVGKVMVGFMTLFGLEIDETDPYSLTSFLVSVGTMATTKRVYTEHSWMNVVARQVIKDLALGVPANISEMGIDTADFYIKFLTSSSIVRFIHTLSALGALTVQGIDKLNDNQKQLLNWNSLAETNVETKTSQAPWDLKSLIKRDRVVNSFGKGGARELNLPNADSSPLTWGAGTTPSMYLLPDTIRTAANSAGGIAGAGELNSLSELGLSTETSGRIKKEEVDILEKRLNASYMPFYLHDLRTNEIISFHAFIESMQDSFSANYDTQTAIGRVEPIYIYKNSSRDMSLSFRVVSTNEQDHAEMWWKINKLLTLVYPQFTEGRALGGTSEVPDKFVQPYSQLVGASPMVRIRVGDVWKSNFSKFNVMRLFGLGGENFELDEQSATTSEDSRKLREYNEKVVDYSSAINGRIQKCIIADETFTNGDKILVAFPDGPPSQSVLSAGDNLFSANSKAELRGVYICNINSAIGTSHKYSVSLASVSEIGARGNGDYVINFDNSSLDALYNRAGNSMQVAPSIEYINSQATLQAGDPPVSLTQTLNTQQTIAKFFKGGAETDANPIMQAFESTSGQGIAGFIASIGIDWNDSRWSTEWNSETDSSRAPQMCKIDIKFLPIHDITPGMASNGFMTAPVYPVGKYANAFKKIIE